MSNGRPLPKPNADTASFWEGCQRQELRFQKCLQCGTVRWPPSIICPRCHSMDTQWIVACGRGVIYTYVVYHVAFHKAFQGDLPYVTAVVELGEGPHILSNIVNCAPHELRCDMPVEVVWEKVIRQFTLPKFKPVRGANHDTGSGT
ncbi:MAG: Zn-ribbon domain-containing OB-fold protein [Deltaproteobacteria bacterium]|nr:Zn-ribbon domain-containing OB-fold protein [Deltaproteobacteria bacterium]